MYLSLYGKGIKIVFNRFEDFSGLKISIAKCKVVMTPMHAWFGYDTISKSLDRLGISYLENCGSIISKMMDWK